MNFHGFLTYRLICLIHVPPWLGQPKIFPGLCWRRNLRGISSFGEFFCCKKTPRRVWGDFLRASWISFKSWKKKFPPKLWRLSKIFGGVVYFKGPRFGFSDPKTGLFFKNIASSIATCNRKSNRTWKLRKSENPSFLLNFWDPRKMNPGFLLKGLLLESQTTNQPKPTINR